MPRPGPTVVADGLQSGEPSSYDYDLFTIGIGSGGTRVSRVSASLGAKVAAVELPFNPVSSDKEGGVGGTCVLRGCVPKKLLMYGSAFKADFEDARGFGWDIDPSPAFNWKALLEAKTKEITRLTGVYKRLLANAGVTVVEGHGRLVDAHTVEVESAGGEVKNYTSKYIVVATGARAMVLDIPGAKEYGITSDEALSLPDLPKSVVIIGAGYISVEFAGIFNGMGSHVDIVFRKDKPLTGFDDEMRAVVARNMEGRGITLHTKSNPVKVEKLASGDLKLTLDTGVEISAQTVMFATGRHPNTRNLNLDKVGVKLGELGEVVVDEYSQSSVPSIYAIGDVTNRMNLTPVALMEGQLLSKTLFGNQPSPVDYRYIASAVFTQPPLSVVGLTEEEAVANATSEVKVFVSSFNPMKYTISGRQEKTVMKLLVDAATDKVLGASMCGPDSPEIMQSIAVALRCGATKADFDTTVGIHPSAAEEFVTMRTTARVHAFGGKI